MFGDPKIIRTLLMFKSSLSRCVTWCCNLHFKFKKSYNWYGSFKSLDPGSCSQKFIAAAYGPSMKPTAIHPPFGEGKQSKTFFLGRVYGIGMQWFYHTMMIRISIAIIILIGMHSFYRIIAIIISICVIIYKIHTKLGLPHYHVYSQYCSHYRDIPVCHMSISLSVVV